jgi:hypothetical protein
MFAEGASASSALVIVSPALVVVPAAALVPAGAAPAAAAAAAAPSGPHRRVGTDRRVDRTRVHEKNSRAPEKGLPPSFLFSMSPRRSGASRLSETATLFGKTSHARFDRWKYFFRFSHVILRKRLVSEQPRIPQTRPRVARST